MNGNKIYKIDKNGKRKRIFFIPGLSVKFLGENSTVEIKEPIPKFSMCKIRLATNSTFKMGTTQNKIKKMGIFINSNSNVSIGDNFQLTSNLEIHSGDKDCTIGDDCMFGKNVLIRCTDDHTLLIGEECANPTADIKIDNHVWLAEDVCVLKGVYIAKNSVVGLKSIVTKSIKEEGSVAAGIPAKVVKKITNWRR